MTKTFVVMVACLFAMDTYAAPKVRTSSATTVEAVTATNPNISGAVIGFTGEAEPYGIVARVTGGDITRSGPGLYLITSPAAPDLGGMFDRGEALIDVQGFEIGMFGGIGQMSITAGGDTIAISFLDVTGSPVDFAFSFEVKW